MSAADRSARHRQRKRQGLVSSQPVRPRTTVLVEAITARSPALPGALCVGCHALFDPAEHGDDRAVTGQRHDEARALCARCPVLAACTTWVKSLPSQQRPVGMIAGRLHDKHTHHREDHP